MRLREVDWTIKAQRVTIVEACRPIYCLTGVVRVQVADDPRHQIATCGDNTTSAFIYISIHFLTYILTHVVSYFLCRYRRHAVRTSNWYYFIIRLFMFKSLYSYHALAHWYRDSRGVLRIDARSSAKSFVFDSLEQLIVSGHVINVLPLRSKRVV